ncbi:polysaccharide biosynthesis/export family protein [Brevundimonas sp. UBA5936]|uniref:polysaccharide biosynthesis/export family protein n=1 Tax=Brevundimonas sp. UBA5936 TaxID=1946133 RepID=UPI0025C455F9|nr:polysaccharide biosynthesis/export family protein [Brevundimonas sp. UBA5936]
MIRMRTFTLATALMAGAAVSACATRSAAPPAVLPMPVVQQAPQPTYRIGPFDQLQVNVFGVPELSGAAQVDGDGQLNLPLVGPVDALGRTPPQLAVEVERAYATRYVRDPNVTIQITTPQSQRVVVSGEVREAGVFPVQGRLTLVQAIAQARGLSDNANAGNVVVLRQAEGQQTAARFDLREIQAGRLADPELAPGDTVIVDTARARRLIRDLAPLGGFLVGIFNVLN